MGATGGGTFAAILLSIPLSAVAVVSVFGLPQLSSIMSSKEDDQDDAEIDREWEDLDGGGSRKRPRVKEKEWGDAELFDENEFSDSGEAEEELLSEKESRPLPRERRLLSRSSRSRDEKLTDDPLFNSFEEDDGRVSQASHEEQAFPDSEKADGYGPPARHDNPFGERRTASNEPDRTRPAESSSSNDFARAVRRLKELGVDHWHVEQGLDADSYLFVCLVDSAAKSGAVHRFEAENQDHMAAVDDVIQQISDWRAQSKKGRASASEWRP